jgi:murein L,D-transpeptidase YcbB/YkuD
VISTRCYALALLCVISTALEPARSQTLATDPLAVAISSELARTPGATSLAALYAARHDAPLWSRAGRATSQALALLDELAHAETYGLDPRDYEADAAPALVSSSGDGTGVAPWAQFDIRLSRAVRQFASDVHAGRIEPAKAGYHLDTARPALDLDATVVSFASAANVALAIAAVEPQFYHYTLLKAALARYRAIAARGDEVTLPPVAHKLQLGDPYAGATALRSLLQTLGDLPAPEAALAPGSGSAAAAASVLDPELVAGLRRFQARHGLAADGSLGTATYAALSTPMASRIRQIELTLERWRWLPPFDSPPIIVNIPQFRLFAFSSTADRVADILQMDVIVGETYKRTQTPVFAADMKYLILRPYWDVPRSILLREMLPKLRADPNYLEREHLEIAAEGGDEASALAPTPENLEALAAGRLRLRQRPGPDNALGLVKFLFPNSYDVYLHSTPAQRLFAESRRAFSHGCIRVSDPVALAVQVLRNTPGDWTAEKVRAAMNGTTSERVNLATPIRVMILYGTALATEAGEVLFFDDIYGYDRTLESLLAARRVTT